MTAHAGPLIAVVLNWRDAESTEHCVRSLLAEPVVDGVIVVDNESTGELRGSFDERVTLVEQAENLGFSRGVNIGLAVALDHGAQAVLVINNDAVVRAGAIDVLVRSWEADPGAGIFAPIVLNADGSLQSTGSRLGRWLASTSDRSEESRIDYLTWACVLVPRRTLCEIGLLDEAFFMYWEDVEFGLRARDHGLRARLVAGAFVTHARSKSHGRAGTKISRYGALGLVVLARRRREPVLWFGTALRILVRIVANAMLLRWSTARAVVDGAWEGWTADLPPIRFPA